MSVLTCVFIIWKIYLSDVDTVFEHCFYMQIGKLKD